MDFSRFRAGIALRTGALFATLAAVAEMMARTQWYVPIALGAVAALIQVALLMRFALRAAGAQQVQYAGHRGAELPMGAIAGELRKTLRRIIK